MCAAADFFHCPAYKLLISDIKSAVKKKVSVNASPEEKLYDDPLWHVSITHIDLTSEEKMSLASVNKSKPSLQLNVKLVWVQGKIQKVIKGQTGNNSLLVTDAEMELDSATIFDYNTVPGGDHPDIKPGALGQIWLNKPKVIIKATKIMYLGDRPIFKEIWRDDVALTKAYLAEVIVPSL